MAVVEPPPRFAVEPLYGLLGRFQTWSGCAARMSPATETALAQVIEWLSWPGRTTRVEAKQLQAS
jgi:hypothetical protein